MLLLWLLMSFALQQMWLNEVGTNAAMYEITINSFESDPNYDRTSIVSKSLRVARTGRNNFVISGEFELLQNWGNENVGFYEVSNSRGMVLIRGSNPFCDAFNSQTPIVLKMRASSTIPPGNYCPLPKGKYEINNFKVQEEDLPLVAVKDTYILNAKMTAPDGHMVYGYKISFTIG